MEQELITLPEHTSSSPVFNGVCVPRSSVFCVMFCRSLFALLFLYFLGIVISVLPRFTVLITPFVPSYFFLNLPVA